MFDLTVFLSVIAALVVFRISEFFVRSLIKRREWTVEIIGATGWLGILLFLVFKASESVR